MRLGRRKRICVRSHCANRKKAAGVLCLLLFIAVLAAASLYFLKITRPLLLRLATSKAQSLVIDIMNSAVEELFRENPVAYSELVTLEKDESGKLRAVQSNLAEAGRLKAELSLRIQEKIADLRDAELYLPLGALSGSDLFAGVGPKIRISLMPYGDTRAEFESSFETVGINQTRLEIGLRVKSELALLMPTVRAACKLDETVPLLQTVVVGEVPDSFFQVDRSAGSLADDALELAPSP